jgi:hypothetical protein
MRDAMEGCGSSFAILVSYLPRDPTAFFLREGVGVFCQTAAAFGLLPQDNRPYSRSRNTWQIL